MAALPDKIQEFFDSWDEAQQQTGTAWNDFFGGNTWDLMTPAQQQAVTEYYFANETINQTYQNMKAWFQNLVDSGEPIPENYEFLGTTTRGGYYKLSTTGNKIYPGFWVTTNNQGSHNVILSGLHFLVNFDLYEPEWNDEISYSPNLNPGSSVYCDARYYWGGHWLYYLCYDSTGTFPTYYYRGKEPYTDRGYNNAGTNFFHQDNPPTLTIGSTYASSISIGGVQITINMDSADIPTDSPWDYYNDLLPGIIGDLPEDVPTDVIPFYPNGYASEDDPTEEEEVEDETGEPPETNEDLMITSPTSFVTMYVLSPAQLASFGNEMWGGFAGAKVVDIAKNFFGILSDTGTCDLSSALQLITSCMVFPFNIASTGINMITGVTGLKVGSGHTTFISTENIFKLNSIVGCLSAGTCAVNPTDPYGKDFRNYYNCSVTAFLPYCGTVELNPTEVMFKELTCKYLIDFLSGECCAIIVNEFGNIVACKQGQIGFSVPLSATNARRIAGNVIDQGLTLVQSIIGSAIAGARAQSTMNAAIDRAQTAQDAISARESGIANITEAATSMGTSVGKFANNLVNGTGFGAPSLSGGGGAAQILVSKQAYVQIRRSKYKIPKNYSTSVGYRSAKSGILSSFAPYVECINVDVSGIEGAEESEKSLIKQLLESGVYI